MEKKKRYLPYVISGLLLIGVVFSIFQLTHATAPNPGHSWADIDSVPLPVNRGGLNTSTAVSKGDILIGTANGDFFHLPTSTNGGATSTWVLTVSSTAPNGVDWEPNLTGWDFLGSSQSCSSGCTVTIPARDVLMIVARIAGYGGSDIASIQFNADAGAHYWDRHVTFAAGTTTATNVQTLSTTLIRLAGNAVTTGRIVEMTCSNLSGVDKSCEIHTQTGTNSAGTAGLLDIGGAEWASSTQVTSVKLTTAGGQTLSAGSGIAIFGRNM